MSSDKRIHIVHVIHHLVIGGMENGIVNLINRMPKERFQHTVVCIEDYSDFRERIQVEGVQVIALHRSEIGVWQVRYKLFKLFRALRPDIVHSRNMSGLDAILPARLAGVRCCIHGEHGRDVDDLHGTHYKFKLLRRLHSPLVSHYITVSNELKQYLVDDVQISAKRVTQILNGVDVDKFAPPQAVDDIRRQFDEVSSHIVSGQRVIIGAVGRLQKVKNYALLINAFSKLLEKGHFKEKLSLVVVGDGPERQNLMDLSIELGVNENVWFAGASSNVSELLQLMNVFVLSSVAEGISNTILEAMATGLPVIATAVGGNVELVRDGETGFLVESDHLDSMAQALQRVCENDELRERQASLARQCAVSEYSLDTMVAHYQDTYEGLLNH